MTDVSHHRDVRRLMVGGYVALFVLIGAVAALALAERADASRAASADRTERTLAMRLAFARQDLSLLADAGAHATGPADTVAGGAYAIRRDRVLADLEALRKDAAASPLIQWAARDLAAHVVRLDTATLGGHGGPARNPVLLDELAHALRDDLQTIDSEVRRRFGAADSTFLARTERSSTIIATALVATLLALLLSGALLVNDLRALERADARQRELVTSLEAALAEVRTLRGILPICSGCKRIRDDAGSWRDVEVYVSSHTDAEFSHGLCEACSKRLYPEFADST
ncbi:MAG: hypothetical protein U9Q74_08720 [Gemmatimonadota bacterium]|nr:hypothetical protein [Gemmatimonadota bacterium]